MPRPSKYTPELADFICHKISTLPYGLQTISKMFEEFPSSSTIYSWLVEFPEFQSKYFTARQAQSNVLADSMLEIASNIPISQDQNGVEKIDSGMLGRAKLEYEIKKWHASKMAPKIWGDAKQIEELHADRDRLKQELDTLKAELDAKNKKEF